MIRTLTAAFLAGTGVIQAETLPPPLQLAEAARLATIQRVTQATICVFSPTDDAGGGSGVVMTADGFAITNFHVTAPCGDYLRCGMADGKLYDAVIIGIDPTGDVALIRLLGRTDFPTVPWGDSDQVRAGDGCLAVGNPFALATNFQPSVTSGIISGIHRYQEPSGTLIEYTDCLQTDASVNPGNSGGPLFNLNGELIGINGRCSFEKRGRVNVGVAYAISVNQVRNFWGHLRSGRIVDHATAGFTVSTRSDGTVAVTNILRTSDAFRRGIRDGDTIVALDRRPVDSANAFKNILGTLPQGWRVSVSVLRDSQAQDYWVRLEGVHAREELLQILQQGAQGLAPESPPDAEPRPEQPPQNPGDKPQPGEPQPGEPQPGEPQPSHPGSPGKADVAPMPPQVAALFEARRGFANYAANRQQRDDVLRKLREFHHVATDPEAHWQLTAQHSLLGQVSIDLPPQSALATYASGRVEPFSAATLATELPRQGGAPNSALPALFLLKRILTLGAERFGDVYYLGQSPWPGEPEVLDVLVGTFETMETHFYVRQESGELVAIEVYVDIEVDPLEILLEQPADSPVGRLPQRLRLRWGDQEQGVLDALQWLPATPPASRS